MIDALRRGTVPLMGLTCSRSGWSGSCPPSTRDLDAVAGGRGGVQGGPRRVRGGQDVLRPVLAERALRRGFAAAEVQISETETPLHRLETVYRRMAESLRTASFPPSALRPVLDAWLFTLESDATAADPGLAGRGRMR